ncbi:MAG: indolepyruvate oxidoreductase subunit beta [Candidatus Bathyarchaeia archaeon]
MESCKIVIAGVGGQGTLLASRMLANAAIKSGLSVKIGETYGMAQRGGPVTGHIQIGGTPLNPQIRIGEADALLAFEPAEGLRRGVTYLKDDGLALVNTRKVAPVEVISGRTSYPEERRMMDLLSRVTEGIVRFDATALAEEAGDPIATNVVMIGALTASGILPYAKEEILKVLREDLSPRYLHINIRAFNLGKETFIKMADQKSLHRE